MISEILSYLNTQLEQLNVFTKFYELTEKISKDSGKIKFPAVFENEYEGLRFGLTDSLIYHQINGKASFTETESLTGCGSDFNYKIPLKCIGFINLDKLNKTKYTPYGIAEAIAILFMSSNNQTLRSTLKSKSVAIFPSSIDANSESVFSDQFSGIEYKMENNKCFIAVDYDVTLIMNAVCFEIECFK